MTHASWEEVYSRYMTVEVIPGLRIYCEQKFSHLQTIGMNNYDPTLISCDRFFLTKKAISDHQKTMTPVVVFRREQRNPASKRRKENSMDSFVPPQNQFERR